MIAEGSTPVALIALDVEIASEEDPYLTSGTTWNMGTGMSARCHITHV